MKRRMSPYRKSYYSPRDFETNCPFCWLANAYAEKYSDSVSWVFKHARRELGNALKYVIEYSAASSCSEAKEYCLVLECTLGNDYSTAPDNFTFTIIKKSDGSVADNSGDAVSDTSDALSDT